jgi:ubiquinone/menaquinone biosynthesis C-methylase UbiE
MEANILEAQCTTLPVEKMPGYRLLARLGKRVLRPGGIELTRQMLDGLKINRTDTVVEFAPGLGETARRAISLCGRYIGIDRDANAIESLRARFRTAGNAAFVHASAENTGLKAGSTSVVWGEAMLSMHSAAQKELIVREAARLLAPGGRYGIHELCLAEDDIDAPMRRLINRELSLKIHVAIQPPTEWEWRSLLEQNGFEVARVIRAPMHLLEPARLFRDEGLSGLLRILFNALHDAEARQRVLAMRRIFRRFERQLSAICLIAVRRSDNSREGY